MHQKFTNDQFHTSQILLSDRVRRYASWCSHVSYGLSIALSLSVFIPSKLEAKLIHISAAIAAYGISNRLDKLVKLASGYESRSHVQSEASYQQWLTHAMKPPMREVAIAPVIEPEKIPQYDWNNINDEAVGFLICGNSGSAKSSLATWLAAHLSQSQPMAVIALDPHFNDCWKLANIRSVGKINLIEAVLNWLLTELDARCDRKGNGQPLGDPMFVICDELNASMERFAKPKVIESALKRLGSEGRKFGLNFCGLNQSSNADALGIDAKYRSNYALILLGQSARTHSKLGKHLQDVAYPCLVTGSISDAIATHPTHGSYQQFKKQGNAPRNLKPINQLPLPTELASILDNAPLESQMVTAGLTPNVARALSSPSSSTAIAPVLQKVVTYLDGKGWKKDYEIKAGIREFKDANTPLPELQGYLQFLEVQGLLETRSTGKGNIEAKTQDSP